MESLYGPGWQTWRVSCLSMLAHWQKLDRSRPNGRETRNVRELSFHKSKQMCLGNALQPLPQRTSSRSSHYEEQGSS